MPGYEIEDLSPEQVERERELYEPFTQAVRELADATIRTTVPAEEVRRAQAEVEAITARLRASQIDGAYGVKFREDGEGRSWGNAAMGLRNPVAPPLVVEHSPERNGEVWADFHLGAAYEGPPGQVHGGVIALVLDQLLGQSAGSGGRPGMTGTLTLAYRRPTMLGDLRAEAWIDRTEGVKTWTKGHVIGPEGVTAEAEGLFILPKWARELLAEREEPAPRYFE